MKKNLKEALKRINTEGLDNDKWGIAENASIGYFIEIENWKDRKLPGTWLYVWLPLYDAIDFECACGIADESINVREHEEMILLYQMES